MSGDADAPLRLGVLVPCRNEAEVIGRKLANLARALWPQGASHALVVVDDGSQDETTQRAREACARLFPEGSGVTATVVSNGVRPGKPGAVRQGVSVYGATS